LVATFGIHSTIAAYILSFITKKKKKEKKKEKKKRSQPSD
jgi:hypothetical protein